MHEAIDPGDDERGAAAVHGDRRTGVGRGVVEVPGHDERLEHEKPATGLGAGREGLAGWGRQAQADGLEPGL